MGGSRVPALGGQRGGKGRDMGAARGTLTRESRTSPLIGGSGVCGKLSVRRILVEIQLF